MLLFPFLLFAQGERIGTLTVNDGLSQGMVQDMIQDRNGYLWFGTKDGLNRYDGYNFIIYKNEPGNKFSINSDWVVGIKEDSRGLLWIETNNFGEIDIFDPKTQRFYHLKLPEKFKDGTPILKTRNSLRFAEDANGNMWTSTLDKFFKINIPNDFLEQIAGAENYVFELEKLINLEVSLPKIKHSLSGELLNDYLNINTISTGKLVGNGITKIVEIDSKTGTYKVLKEVPLKSFESNFHNFSGFLEDSKGTFWFGNRADSTLEKYENGKFSSYPIITGFSQFREDAFGNFYMQDDKKMWFISKESLESEAPQKVLIDSLKKNVPGGIMIDNAGIFWVLTNGFGLIKYNTNPKKFKTYLKGLSAGYIYLNESSEKLWAEHCCLYQRVSLDPSSDKSANFIRTKKYRYNLRLKNQPELVQEKLSKYVDDEALIKKTIVENKTVLEDYIHFYENRKGELWTNRTGGVLGKINLETLEIEDFYDEKITQKIGKKTTPGFTYEDINGDLFLCTSNGLIRAEFSDTGLPEKFTLYQNEPTNLKSLSRNHTISLCDDPADPEQFIWVGIKGGGLNKLNKKTGEITRFSKKDGLPDDVIYGILSDDSGNLWMSSNRGVFSYHPVTEKFRYFGVKDGLQDMEFNTNSFAKLPSGELAFGGVKGINIFHPDSVSVSDYIPPAVITSVRINDESVNFSKEKELDLIYSQNTFAFQYAVMDFTNPSENRYQYMLEGYDNDWNDAGTGRLALYSKLPPGDYIFKVRGSNNARIWSEQPAMVAFVIHAPWWKTSVAYFSYLLLFFGSILWLYRFQLRREKLKNQLVFEQKEAERLNELAKLKTNFFSNITHEFRTPLTLILEPVRQLLKKEKPTDEDLKQNLTLVKNNSEKLLGLVNQLLDISKLEGKKMELKLSKGNLAETIRPILQSFRMLAEKKRIKLKMSVDESLDDFYFDKDKIEKITYNLLSNALKFTKKGQVELEIEAVDKDNFMIQVSDTGIGISPEQLPRVFDRFHQAEGTSSQSGIGTGIGLALVKELVELMNGTIDAKSQLNVGTTFEIKLPIPLPSPKGETPSAASRQVAPGRVSPLGDGRGEITAFQKKKAEKSNSKPLILLVEDNDEMRTFTKKSLESNFKILEAPNGVVGIKLAKEYLPDLILSDVMMPEKDGLELTRELKNYEMTAHIPIILLSAKSKPEAKSKGIKSGADLYVTKPFETEDLIMKIEDLIGK